MGDFFDSFWPEKKDPENRKMEGSFEDDRLWEDGYSSNNLERMGIVYACVKVIAETLGVLPLQVTKVEGLQKKVDHKHYLAGWLRDEPNALMSWQSLKESLATQMLLEGNAFTQQNWKGGKLEKVLPITHQSVTMSITSDAVPIYEVNSEQNYIKNGKSLRPNISHFRGVSMDGITGISPLRHCAETFHNANYVDIHGKMLYKSGARPTGILSFEANPRDKEIREKVKEEWEKTHAGAENAGKTVILPFGAKYTPVTMSMSDMEYISMRRMTLEDIARIFRIQLHKLQILNDATYSNIESQAIEFVQDTALVWVRRLEEGMTANWLTRGERKAGYEISLDMDGLIRGNYKDRVEGLSKAVQSFMSINEARSKENLAPQKGGDTVRFPLSNFPIDQEYKNYENKITK